MDDEERHGKKLFFWVNWWKLFFNIDFCCSHWYWFDWVLLVFLLFFLITISRSLKLGSYMNLHYDQIYAILLYFFVLAKQLERQIEREKARKVDEVMFFFNFLLSCLLSLLNCPIVPVCCCRHGPVNIPLQLGFSSLY